LRWLSVILQLSMCFDAVDLPLEVVHNTDLLRTH